MAQHEHKNGMWEFDPKKKHFSIRCCICGEILQRVTYDKAKQMRPVIRAFRRELERSDNED